VSGDSEGNFAGRLPGLHGSPHCDACVGFCCGGLAHGHSYCHLYVCAPAAHDHSCPHVYTSLTYCHCASRAFNSCANAFACG
jgi:hypothetical protein